MLLKVAALIVLTASAAAAQVQSRPTEPPLVTAANEAWYQLREPIEFAGDLYFPAGPVVFFDGNVMARVGHYNGVPIYMDTTFEPYSVVLVPVRRGLLQPYERRRDGDLAGTTGSRTPSFPVAATPRPAATGIPMAALAPTQPQLSIGAIGVYTPRAEPPAAEPVAAVVGGMAESAPDTADAPFQPVPVVTLRGPESNDGVWLEFAGARWVSAGAAVPLRARDFRVVGDHAGFPVFMREDREDVIYLPTRAGMVAPYRRK